METSNVQKQLPGKKRGKVFAASFLTKLNQTLKNKTKGTEVLFYFLLSVLFFYFQRTQNVCESKHFTSVRFGPCRQGKDCLWNYLFLAPHNIVSHCEEILHLKKQKQSVTKKNKEQRCYLKVWAGSGTKPKKKSIKIRAICFLSRSRN